ncbi:DUF3105 domain-containing protein [Nitriliruptor alkaliphilus]|uniref:DUF3105 domain-containing protein n=1 Tax=Nitriliruptor alkaliphilus TaxID=427918 RepID=UPI000696DA06|nr:DUF3105 domain-containing protein [Nitriliruptor alkaliphilus]
MAERERMTNKERRAAGREERKRKEAEAKAKAKRDQIRNSAITAVVVLIVGVIVFQAVRPDPAVLDEAILVSSEAAEEAREAAGCEMLAERDPLPERYHFEASAAPDPDTIYPDIRPTHSGPHTVQTTPASLDGFSRQIDERSSTHNLEHGAVIVWHDPDQTDGGEIARWGEVLNANGFGDTAARTGSAILTAPYEDPGISSGKAIAFRAWGTAMDCDEFDQTVANAFVAQNFGTRGIGPERHHYPADTLEFSDLDVGDTPSEEAPIDGDMPETVPEDELEDELGEENVEDATDEIEDGDQEAADGEG